MNKQNKIDIIPNLIDATNLAYCFMFYDFIQPYSSSWLEMTEAIFTDFGIQADFTIGGVGEKYTKGNYRRIKKKLSNFLNEKEVDCELDIRVDSPATKVNEDFFPCDIRIAFNETSYGLKSGVVALRSNIVDNYEELINRVSHFIFQQTGTTYAHVFDFPACYGPDYYLSAVGAVPRGHSTLENRSYIDRLTRWRDNTWHLGLRPSQGYLREIYPVNFVLKNHLDKKFNGRRFMEYMESVGSLIEVPNTTGIYRWDIHKDKLSCVRNELENTGLILSAETRAVGPISET